MKFACYTDWAQLPESANVLFEKGARENMFFSRSWYENLVATTLESNQAMLLACVVEKDTVLTILPLIEDLPASDRQLKFQKILKNLPPDKMTHE